MLKKNIVFKSHLIFYENLPKKKQKFNILLKMKKKHHFLLIVTIML